MVVVPKKSLPTSAELLLHRTKIQMLIIRVIIFFETIIQTALYTNKYLYKHLLEWSHEASLCTF